MLNSCWFPTPILAIISRTFSDPVHAFAMPSESDLRWQESRRSLPYINDNNIKRPIIIGYAHNVKSGKAEQAIKDGVNVIIWSFLHLNTENDTAQHMTGSIRTDLDLSAITTLRDKYDDIVHLAAFGGWNAPHPPTAFNGEQWCEVFMEFNKVNGYIFDGVDWDYEGHDDLNSPTATFNLETLDIMADFSTHAKEKYGMIVSMAPAESYLDATVEALSDDAIFSLQLDLPPRAWTSSKSASDEDRRLIESAGFSHAGRQCYAYVLAKAGTHIFDWISIQLYEAYSTFAHDVVRRNIDPVDALVARIENLTKGYTVTGMPPTLSSSEYEVKIPLNQLVIGVANTWADGFKFCNIKPDSLYNAFQMAGYGGIMFWVSTAGLECSEISSPYVHFIYLTLI